MCGARGVPALTHHDGSQLPTLRDYWRIIWVRKWIVVAAVALCTAGMFLVANSKPRIYEATARLMYEQPLAIGSAVSGITATDPNSVAIEMQSAVGLIGGPEVAGRARALLGGPASVPHYTVTATVLPSSNTTASSVSSTALGITVQSRAARASAAIANAFAQALIGLRKETEIAQILQAEAAIRSQMKMFATPKLKQTSDYALLTQQLRSLQILAATTSGDFAIVAPAIPPSAPISPRPKRSAAMGLAVGLFVGVVLAFILSQFDTRVRTARELSEELELTLIGRVPRVHGRLAHEGRQFALGEPDGKVEEALRSVRSALDYANPPGEVRSLLFTSSHRGEGKTAIVCSLGATLARAGKHVIVLDADMRRPRVHEVTSICPTMWGCRVSSPAKSLSVTPLNPFLHECRPAETARTTARRLRREPLAVPLTWWSSLRGHYSPTLASLWYRPASRASSDSWQWQASTTCS